MRLLLAIALVVLFGSSCVSAQTAVYPGALSTSQNLKVGVNGVSTMLAVDISPSTTNLTVSNCAGIVAYTLITIDQEIMDVTGCSGTALVVDARGFDNTTATSHLAGAVIYANVDAWHHNTLAAEIEAIETALGINLTGVPVKVTSCGSSSSCASPSVKTTGQIVTGTVTFSSSTTATITGIPGFTSSTSFVCSATDPSHAYTWVIQNQSATSITITAGTSNSDTWTYSCQGY